MQTFSLVCRLAVAGVLLTSALAKLRSPSATREAAVAFGVRRQLAPLVAWSLPAVELAVAVLLLPGDTARVGALAAIVLLVVFSSAVATQLQRGNRPACQCFGRVSHGEISGRTLLRNALLAGLAGTALAVPAPGPAAYAREVGPVLTGTVLAAALALVLGIVLTEMSQDDRPVPRRRRWRSEPPAVARERATAAPEFRLPDLDGRLTSLDDLRRPGLPLVIVFLSPGCGPCRALRPVVARWAEVYRRGVHLVVVASGSHEANRLAFVESPLPVLLDEAGVRAAYGVAGTPAAVVVDADGSLRLPVARGEQGVRQLLAELGRDEGSRMAAPSLQPPGSIDLDSRPVAAPMVRTRTAESEGRPAAMAEDELTGVRASLDALGAVVWSCLDGRSSLGEIAQDLAAVYRAPYEVVAADVVALVRSLGRLGLLEGVAGDLPDDAHQATGARAGAAPRSRITPDDVVRSRAALG